MKFIRHARKFRENLVFEVFARFHACRSTLQK